MTFKICFFLVTCFLAKRFSFHSFFHRNHIFSSLKFKCFSFQNKSNIDLLLSGNIVLYFPILQSFMSFVTLEPLYLSHRKQGTTMEISEIDLGVLKSHNCCKFKNRFISSPNFVSFKFSKTIVRFTFIL